MMLVTSTTSSHPGRSDVYPAICALVSYDRAGRVAQADHNEHGSGNPEVSVVAT